MSDEALRAWATWICNHSGSHTAGDGNHDADRWGPCSQCLHYARITAERIAQLEAAIRCATAPTPCPVCGGAGVVDTSPPGAEHAPWLQTDTDCPACGGSGEITEETP